MSHNIGEKGTVMIEIQNLTKVFQEQTVLQNINATFDAGLIHGMRINSRNRKKMTKGARREIVRCEQTDRTLLRDLPSQ